MNTSSVWEELLKSNHLTLEAIKIEIKTEPFNTKQKIYICLKNKNDLPIIQIDKPIKINELEEKASEIASFLKIPVKGI